MASSSSDSNSSSFSGSNSRTDSSNEGKQNSEKGKQKPNPFLTQEKTHKRNNSATGLKTNIKDKAYYKKIRTTEV